MTRKHVTKRTLFGGTIAALSVACLATATLAYFYGRGDAAIFSLPASVPQVVVSKPLARVVESRLGFLGQFSAIEQVELRAQVGGTLTGIYFKDGDIIHKGDLLFTIDARPSGADSKSLTIAMDRIPMTIAAPRAMPDSNTCPGLSICWIASNATV
jgi:multidrug efflux pump subunit AcrA (membrane-fusion protein)